MALDGSRLITQGRSAALPTPLLKAGLHSLILLYTTCHIQLCSMFLILIPLYCYLKNVKRLIELKQFLSTLKHQKRGMMLIYFRYILMTECVRLNIDMAFLLTLLINFKKY